ncbi:NYN domain-containing protein [Alkalinema pantanalense CENA528]|uniref:NYN domain-containing protein n=1 Tax=Alkalinema pantanalense TaxID=1620705 RepID=UPI003D6E6271
MEKIAIFLDAESLSGRLSSVEGEPIIDRLRKLGTIIVRRAYGNFSQNCVSAHQKELNQQGFELIHTFHPVSGKNSADIQMVVDVMDYVSRIPELQVFAIATGDSDFLPLYRRLRELGKSVIGISTRSTTATLSAHFDDYIQLCHLPQSPGATEPRSTSTSIVTAVQPTPSPTTTFPLGSDQILPLLQEILPSNKMGIKLATLVKHLKQNPELAAQPWATADLQHCLQRLPNDVMLIGDKVFSPEQGRAFQASQANLAATSSKTASSKVSQTQQQAIEHLREILLVMTNGISLSKLEVHLKKRMASFSPQAIGFETFLAFLQSQPQVVYLTLDRKKAYPAGQTPNTGQDKAVVVTQQILSQTPKGIEVSSLKNEIRRQYSKFDEKKLGHKRFLDFLKSHPKVIKLEQKGKTWWAKAV